MDRCHTGTVPSITRLSLISHELIKKPEYYSGFFILEIAIALSLLDKRDIGLIQFVHDSATEQYS